MASHFRSAERQGAEEETKLTVVSDEATPQDEVVVPEAAAEPATAEPMPEVAAEPAPEVAAPEPEATLTAQSASFMARISR